MNTRSKYSALIGLAVILLMGCGCSNTREIGTIGGTTFYRVQSSQFVGPNFTALVTKDCETDAITINQVFAGPGIGGATISALGNTSAAAVLGLSFPKNVGDRVDVTGTGGNATGGTGGNATANGGNASGGSASSSAGGGSSTSTGGTFTPPGLINNPGHGGSN